MSEQTEEDALHSDDQDAAASQAVASLKEIARQLRELADFAAELSKRPLFEETLH